MNATLRMTPADERVLIGLALALMAGSAVALFLPRPSERGMRTRHERAVLQARIAEKAARKRLTSARATLAARTWTGTPDAIAPGALATVTRLCARHGLKLVSFRPQRVNENGPLRQFPLVATVEGGFTPVTKFQRDLEAAGTKLAVNLLQIASSDAESDRVTATVGLVAYLAPPRATPPATTPGPKGGARGRA